MTGSAILQPLTQLGTVVGLVADQAFRCFAGGDEPFRDRQSCASPPVRRIARRRPRASASAWTFVLRPPLERPIACFCSPFSARCRAVRFDVRGVDHLRGCRSSVSGKFPEQIFPDPTPRPAHEAVINRRRRSRRTIDRRAIAPATAAFQHLHDAADDAAVVHPLNPADIRGQEWLNPLPLPIAQPKQIPAHNFKPFPSKNHHLRTKASMTSNPNESGP
jgi:hypothetical protein